MPFDFVRLEASRLARAGRDTTAPVALTGRAEDSKRPRYHRQDYAVARVYDDAREPEILRFNLTPVDAEAYAGRMRDGMTDADVKKALDEGWNYKVIFVRGNKPKTRRTWKAVGR
jgi:hypothetical protein